MAQSRLERIGTIYTRITSLMKGGALKLEDKPLWYIIYEAFPPKEEPRYNRPAPNIPIRDIFYEEDIVRARFQNDYSRSLITNIARNDTESTTQKFISLYRDLEKSGIQAEELYEKAVTKFIEENPNFVKSRREKIEEDTSKNLQQIKVKPNIVELFKA